MPGARPRPEKRLCFGYLASPYSHDDAEIRYARYWSAVSKAAELMAAGESVFSPIAHTHEIGMILRRSVDHDFWLRQDLAILQHATMLWVLRLPGWEQSRGVAEEIEFARETGIAVEFIDP